MLIDNGIENAYVHFSGCENSAVVRSILACALIGKKWRLAKTLINIGAKLNRTEIDILSECFVNGACDKNSVFIFGVFNDIVGASFVNLQFKQSLLLFSIQTMNFYSIISSIIGIIGINYNNNTLDIIPNILLFLFNGFLHCTKSIIYFSNLYFIKSNCNSIIHIYPMIIMAVVMNHIIS